MAPQSHADSGENHADASFDIASEWEDSLSIDGPPDVQTAAHGAAHIPSAAPSGAMEGGYKGDASQNPEIAETVEEIRFYLEHFMAEQAHAAMEKLQTLTSDASILDPLRAAFANASQPVEEREPQIAEINADDIPNFEVAIETESESGMAAANLVAGYHQEPRNEFDSISQHPGNEALPRSPEPPASSEPIAAEAMPADQEGELPAFVAELEAALGDSFPVAPSLESTSSAAHSASGWPTKPAPEHAREAETDHMATAPAGFEAPAHQVPAVHIPTVHVPAVDVPAIHVSAMNEIEKSTGAAAASSAGMGAASAPAPALSVPAMAATATDVPATPASDMTFSSMSYSATPVRPLGTQGAPLPGGIDLSEMFGALRQELEEESVVGDDDPETHYSLGVAFREMGLLDEAIAEFQKVCTAIDRGKAFTQPIQTYTWLAQCFLDKGVPESAIHWYEKALNLPGINEEGRLAIHYELGSACESAQDRPSALRHFTDVYSANIDYRDVAERIQALKS
jgi:tetratricopeptide (TPR) repeat protein